MGEYLTTDELRARGWSTSLIGRFLGQPDRVERPNPRRGPTRYYAAARVEGLERTAEFRRALRAVEKERARKRRTADAGGERKDGA